MQEFDLNKWINSKNSKTLIFVVMVDILTFCYKNTYRGKLIT